MTNQANKNNELQVEFERGFINRYFAQISLPHSKLEVSTFTRKSGSLCQDSCHPLNLNQESGKDTIYGPLFTRA